MKIILRAATVADQPSITRLVRAARLNPLRLHWANFVVAEDLSTHAVVGVGQLRPHGRDLELASLVVVDGLRGRGIGAALVRTLISRASGPLYLMCEGKLATYYRRFGFAELTQAAAVPPGLRPAYLAGRLLGPFLTRLRDTPVRLAVMAHPGVAPFD
jgi:N-acetylglutamate synthase-like GNAT family acetyltransferase